MRTVRIDIAPGAADPSIIDVFFSGAQAVLDAVSDGRVSERWDSPSILEGQAVSGLVGHLARGGVWVVGDYLSPEELPGPVTFDSAGAYFAHAAGQHSDTDHAAIRQRGAQIGSEGHSSVVATLTDRLAQLRDHLEGVDPQRLVGVIGGAVMHLEDYLQTRIVEQVVHLDDLARSVQADPWPIPQDCAITALGVGVETGRLRFGDTLMLRALFRERSPEVLPVL